MVEPTDESPKNPHKESKKVQKEIDQTTESTPENNSPPIDPADENILDANGQDPVEIAQSINEQGGITLDQIDEENLLQQVAGVFLLWWHWAYFEITIVNLEVPHFVPPKIIPPETIKGSDTVEFVYDIHDHGYKLSTSKGEEMYSIGMSMCKMFYTIEKMIFILIERLKETGTSTETEVQVSFDGHLLAQRKAFESIINLNYNVVVTNFDPGVWGENYLATVKRMVDRGYGYPPEAPRDVYKNTKRDSSLKRGR